jgi:hypothetical protein
MTVRFRVMLPVFLLLSDALLGYTLGIGKGGTGNGHILVNGAAKTLPFSQSYSAGTHLTVTAVPETGSQFDNWSGSGMSGSTNPVSFDMPPSNINATANFSLLYTLAITKGGTGTGRIRLNGILHDLPYSVQAVGGTEFQLEAIPAAGSVFAGWSGSMTISTPGVTFHLDSDKNLTATFNLESYTFTIVKGGTGTGSIRVNGVNHTLPFSDVFSVGSTLTVEAMPDVGCFFVSWEGDMSGTGINPYTYTVPANSVSYTVYFEKCPMPSVDMRFVSFNPVPGIQDSDGDGYVTARDLKMSITLSNYHCPKYSSVTSLYAGRTEPLSQRLLLRTYEFTANHTSILLTDTVYHSQLAPPDSGIWSFYLIADFGGFTMTSYIFDGKFESEAKDPDMYDLTVSKAGSGAGQIKVNNVLHSLPYAGQTIGGVGCHLEAIPASSSVFAGWTDDITSSSPNIGFIMNSDLHLTVTFNQAPVSNHTLTISKTGSGNGRVKVNAVQHDLPYTEQASHNAQYYLEAIPTTGSVFAGWSGSVFSAEALIGFIMNSDKNLKAAFSQAPWQAYYVNEWGFIGTGNNRIQGWSFVPGEASGEAGLTGPPLTEDTSWVAIRGGFAESITPTMEKALILSGELEFIGGGFEAWSGFRFGIFDSDSVGTLITDATPGNGDSTRWSGKESGCSGYLFAPHSGHSDQVTWQGSHLDGSYGGIVDRPWLSTDGANDYVLGNDQQKPAGAVGNAGVYHFAISVQPRVDGTQELRFTLVKDDESYCYGGTVIDHNDPPATRKFNGVCFAIHNNAATTALELREVKVDMGVPIEVPSWVTRVESAGGKAVPTAFALNPNYPNPFNSGTTIPYELMTQAEVTLSVYDISGRCIKTLVHGLKHGGLYGVQWDGTDAAGSPASSGIYLCRLVVKSEYGIRVFSRKMLMLE